MDRLTFDGNFCDIAMCQEVRGGPFCKDGYCSQRRVWERLKEYEDMEEQGLLTKTDECCDVHHAHWIKENDFYYDPDSYCSYAEYSCSYCGRWVDDRFGLPEYCPDCGEKMERE